MKNMSFEFQKWTPFFSEKKTNKTYIVDQNRNNICVYFE